MNDKVIGINEEKIDSLILDIYDHAESVKKLLTEIDDLINDNINYFDIELKSDFLNFHKELKSSFPIVTQNILSYATDLKNLKKKYSITTSNIADKINQSSKKNKKGVD